MLLCLRALQAGHGVALCRRQNVRRRNCPRVQPRPPPPPALFSFSAVERAPPPLVVTRGNFTGHFAEGGGGAFFRPGPGLRGCCAGTQRGCIAGPGHPVQRQTPGRQGALVPPTPRPLREWPRNVSSVVSSLGHTFCPRESGAVEGLGERADRRSAYGTHMRGHTGAHDCSFAECPPRTLGGFGAIVLPRDVPGHALCERNTAFCTQCAVALAHTGTPITAGPHGTASEGGLGRRRGRSATLTR